MQPIPVPFFFVVDDAGFSTVLPDGRGETIEFGAYENLRILAEQFGLRIPLCFTMKFLDLDNRSGVATPLPYAEKLLAYLESHSPLFEFGDHGLTHQFEQSFYEFFNPFTGEAPPREVQEQHVACCEEIWTEGLGLPMPRIFVPPSHGWQQDVTDQAYAAVGIQHLISLPQQKASPWGSGGFPGGKSFQFFQPVHAWQPSSFMNFFPRSSMGLPLAGPAPGRMQTKFIKNIVASRSSLGRCFLCRKWLPWRAHSFMTHIGNFMGQKNLQFWQEFLTWVSNNPRLKLITSHDEAIREFQATA